MSVSGLTGHAASWLPHGVVRSLSSIKAARTRALASRKFASLIEVVAPDNVGARVLSATSEVVVFQVETTDGPSTIVKIATSDTTAPQLLLEADALDELAGLVCGTPLANQVARVLDRGSHEDCSWFSQSFMAGRATPEVAPVELTTAAATALAPFHRLTSQESTCGDQLLQDAIIEPLDVIRRWCDPATEQLREIEEQLSSQLRSRDTTTCRLHGDFGPKNILWEPAQLDVSAIVDWRFDETRLPPEIDLMHFAISLVATRDRLEYGQVVTRLVSSSTSIPDTNPLAVACQAGPNNLELRTAVTLTWLYHVAFGLEKQEHLRSNPIWLHNNVTAVINALT